MGSEATGLTASSPTPAPQQTVFRGDVVLLSTAEWANPFWTNKQHTALQLARLGCRVFYVDSLGLRRPTATAKDFKRLFQRLLRAFRPPRRAAAGVWVWSPLLVPAARHSWLKALNRIVLRVGLAFWLLILGFRKAVLWTYNPITSTLLRLQDYRLVVYHCVDDIAAQPGMDAAGIWASEQQLCEAADLVFVTSKELLASRASLNPANTYYYPNVVDYAHFARGGSPDGSTPADLLGSCPSPRIGFVGAISSYKVDFLLLRELAEANPQWSFVLLGSVGEGDPLTDPALLEGLANLHLLGPRSYADLPAYMAAFDVALIPAPINAYTRAMFPMKFFEYLAAGAPVVATPLPALEDFGDVFLQASTPAQFTAAIASILEGQSGLNPEHADRLARAYSYRERTQWMLQHLTDKLSSRFVL
jgi:glycosyltransferase involved in cell wall biosynthesis